MCNFKRRLPLLVLLCALSAAGRVSAQETDLRLRVAWGGGTARQWQGTLSIQDGTFSQLSYLGLEADEVATIFADGNRVTIQQRTARDYDGFDVQVQAPADAVLVLDIAPRHHTEEAQHIEVPLADLISGYHHAELDSQDNQLLIQRASGDRLRVTFDRDSLVLNPGESFTFELKPHLLGSPKDTRLRCHVQLFPTRGEDQLWDQSVELVVLANGEVETLAPFTVSVPDDEGVYEIIISVYAKKRFRDTFVRAKPLHQRKIQLVVIAPDSAPDDEKSWELVDTIDPNHASWMEWLTRVPKLPLLPDFRQEPLGNGMSRTRRHLEQELVELDPGGWQAYPLPIRDVGKPHILEIEYPSDVPQALGISLIEPNAIGKVVPLGLDSGVDVADSASSQSARILRHRLLFWPRTKAPLVLLTNRRDKTPAMFGKLRVLAGPDSLPSAARKEAAGESASRLLAVYFDRPFFAENFSAREAVDPWTHRSLKDWNTFHEGGTRLVEYLKHVGYNGAIVSVACQGGTIYPSNLLKPTPKYDTGAFFSTGQDPVQKDILEMMFRLFDRAGLKLVPAVEFSSPLLELENQLRQDPRESEGIALLNDEGKSWVETRGANRGMAPYYNPLDPRVQAAMRKVLNEITDRYGQHASFGGISLQMGPDTFSILPGEAWAFDPVTRKRFENEVGYLRKENTDRKSTGFRPRDRQKAWLAWRSRILAQFHRDILEDLSKRRADGQLFLLGGSMFTNPSVQSLLYPTLPNRLRVNDVLLQFGMDVEQYASEPRIVFFRPDRTAPRTPLAAQAVNINLATNPVVDRTFSRVQPAASLFYNESLPLSLPSFDAASPFGRENTRTVLFSQITPSADQNRRRFVHQMALRDVQYMADGGWMLPMGQEDALRGLFATLIQLPAKEFTTVEPKASGLPSQPLVVRTLADDGRVFIYVVNDSPWNLSAEIDLRADGPCTLTAIGDRDAGRFKSMGPHWTWELDMRPYDLIAAVVSSPEVQVETWRVTIDRTTYAQLRRQVNEINARATMLARPSEMGVLTNPSFEIVAEDRLPGWFFRPRAGTTIGPDENVGFDGKRSLKMTSNGPVAWIRSDPFDPPKTGRIAVIVRLKTADPDKQPPLRLAIEGQRLNGTTYYKPFNVGQGARVGPLASDWGKKPFVLLISDLPVRELANLRVGFDLMGPGEVWIDDVQVYDRWFPKNERDDLMIMSGLAARSLSMGHIGDCQRILSGYWPQFLLEYVPVGEPRVATAPSNRPPTNRAFPPPQPQGKDEKEKPSMLDKVKRRLPTKVFPFRR